MPKHASEQWDNLVPILIDTGIATSIDAPALQRMCEWWHELQTLRNMGKTDDMQHIRTMATCQRQWNDLAFRFGLTPTDRAKLSIPKPSDDDPTAKYLA